MCFGRRERHHQGQWNEEESLLDDELQIISNPCFLDTGKGQHKTLPGILGDSVKGRQSPQYFINVACSHLFPEQVTTFFGCLVAIIL